MPIVLGVSREPSAPEWVRFEAQLPGDIVSWGGSAGGESAWLALVRDWVSQVPTCYGHIANDANSLGTHHEISVGRHAWDTVPRCEERLRGSSWVTVCAAGLAGKLGGADALAASGAFVEVAVVAGGSVFLKTTDTVDEYDVTAAARAFSALAPAIFA